ncbi:MAG: GAF domain-containing protein [Candidatus Korobacteraceae bacterium]
MPTSYQTLTDELTNLAVSAENAEHLMTMIVERLQELLKHYNWVGFYLLDEGENGAEPMLVLGPYVGAETPHKRIPLHQGICGAAVSSAQTVIVDDVNADPRYLSCSIETKSEIVAPVFVNGKVVGELDIDSHIPAAFTDDDRRLVEHCASLVGRYLERTTGFLE